MEIDEQPSDDGELVSADSLVAWQTLPFSEGHRPCVVIRWLQLIVWVCLMWYFSHLAVEELHLLCAVAVSYSPLHRY